MNLTIKMKKDLIDDLYALHGEEAIKSYLSVIKKDLEYMVKMYIDSNLKENENYYIERSGRIVDELLKKKEIK